MPAATSSKGGTEPPVACWSGVRKATDRWHATGLWIRPARLANAWLKQPGITLVARSCITELRHTGTGWDLVAAGWPHVARI